MCTKNNSDLGLSNGDLGVLIGKSETRRFLFKIFDNHNDQLIRLINPSAIISRILGKYLFREET